MAYAKRTKVAVQQSRAEIERLLMSHKCSQFATAVDHDKRQARVQFRAHDRIVRFELTLPPMRNGIMTETVAQGERQRWRALLLVIKAKLESVDSQIATFEEEFMAHIVLPGDQTVNDLVAPLIASAYSTGKLPQGLLALPAKGETTVENGR